MQLNLRRAWRSSPLPIKVALISGAFGLIAASMPLLSPLVLNSGESTITVLDAHIANVDDKQAVYIALRNDSSRAQMVTSISVTLAAPLFPTFTVGGSIYKIDADVKVSLGDANMNIAGMSRKDNQSNMEHDISHPVSGRFISSICCGFWLKIRVSTDESIDSHEHISVYLQLPDSMELTNRQLDWGNLDFLAAVSNLFSHTTFTKQFIECSESEWQIMSALPCKFNLRRALETRTITTIGLEIEYGGRRTVEHSWVPHGE